MKKNFKHITKLITAYLAVFSTTIFYGNKVFASSASDAVEAIRPDNIPKDLFGDSGVITNITNTVLSITALIAIIMLIFGGLRYVTSGGDSQKVTAAKNTILYAIVGLIIAILSFAIVNFVLNTLGVSNIECTNC